MEASEREFHVYRIASGLTHIDFEDQSYLLVSPTAKDRYIASIKYKEVLSSLRFDDLLTQSQAESILRRMRIWTSEHEQQLQKYIHTLEQLKISLFDNHKLYSRQQDTLKNIKRIEKAITNFLSEKYSLHMMTAEYYADIIKQQFLIGLCLRDTNLKSIYTDEDFLNSDGRLIEYVISTQRAESLTNSDFKELARTEPWRSLWSVGKDKIFDKPACDWSQEQTILVSYAKMYDSVYESSECPSDDVIQDEYMLDGWFGAQKRKRDEDQSKNKSDSHMVRPGGGQETMIMAHSLEDAEDVYNLNDATNRHHLKVRNQYLKQHEGNEVRDQDLPDVQMRINREIVQAVKGR